MNGKLKSHVFKVPKVKSKENFERISLNSHQYKSDVWPIIASNFKKPSVSQKRMNISSAWLINNKPAEERYFKCRKHMRQNMPMLSYSVGFIYVNSLKKVNNIAQFGKIENGNVRGSQLATSSMGVSLCQYPDIYHPGIKRCGVPDKGYLVLIKYLKGKINYVPCDPSPMDPQPEFDCHMVKNPLLDSSVTCDKAFHQTQIFIYEYTEDGEIVTCPSKILPFAAVEFNWNGPPLYKIVESVVHNTHKVVKHRKEIIPVFHPLITQEVRHSTTTSIHEENASSTIPFVLPFEGLPNIKMKSNAYISQEERHSTTTSIHQENASSTIPFVLSFEGLPNIKMKSNAYIYFTNPSVSFLRSDNPWKISGVLLVSEFENELKRLQINWTNNAYSKSSKNLIDPLSQDIIISLNRPNLLTSTNTNSESVSFNECPDNPQFVSYIRIVVQSSQQSKRLSQLFNSTKSMGFISRPHDPDICILMFPNGSLSKKLGIPGVSDTYYFHGLVFHSQHPQFIILNSVADSKKEKDIYFSCLSTFKKQSIQSKLNSSNPLICNDVLKQTMISQVEVQKAFLFKIVKPLNNTKSIVYNSVCFDSKCENHDCRYHNPCKKLKLCEITNKENIKSATEPLSLKKTKAGTERHCLSEKLFDYLKVNLNEKDTYAASKELDHFVNENSRKNLVQKSSVSNVSHPVTETEAQKHVAVVDDNSMEIDEIDLINTDVHSCELNIPVVNYDVHKKLSSTNLQSSEIFNNQISNGYIKDTSSEVTQDKISLCGDAEQNFVISGNEISIVLHSPTSRIQCGESDMGNFFPIRFMSYCKAGYSDSKSMYFSHSSVNCKYERDPLLSHHMWSLDQGHFKKVKSLHGISSYE